MSPSERNVDTNVDEEIASCLSLEKPRSFFLYAGAGSGKTHSLVNALEYVRDHYRQTLFLRGQSVRVVTYTNAACDEISRRIENPLFRVSTIHSFAWDLIGGFNNDIRSWLQQNLSIEISELETQQAAGRLGTKTAVARQAKIESKNRRLANLPSFKTFTYNPNGENKERNSLSHSEVITICADFLNTKPLMQRILVNQFPIFLIDESQDTNKLLIDALFAVEAANRERFSLGLFGDTMQRIYSEGKEQIEKYLPDGWSRPMKVLNRRSPKRIVRLINQVRSGVDGISQQPTSEAEGCVRLFILPSDAPDKPAIESAVRDRMASETHDEAWKDLGACKILTLEHHMAASRLGFWNLFEPLYAIEDFRTGLLNGKLSAIEFFTENVSPLLVAHKNGDKLGLANVVRERSPLLSIDALRENLDPRQQLQVAKNSVDDLLSLWSERDPSCGEVLDKIAESGLFTIPDILVPLVAIRRKGAKDDNAPLSESLAALEKFLSVPFSEVEQYNLYVSDKAPFGTHQGVKGLEFERVMVLIDDTDARGFLFAYEKLLGAAKPSTTDIKNEREGKETSLDRTRRLFYVTCSRAMKSLALVVYSSDCEAVKSHVIRNGWFDESEIVVNL